MRAYYARRAREYERIYEKPERQEDLARLAALLADDLAGHEVLEIACGTGYWSQVIARSARRLHATDAVAEPLEIAKAKDWPPDKVTFGTCDAYDPAAAPGDFTALFAGFWWSHVPRPDLPAFLDAVHRRLGPGGRVVFVDNRFVAGSSTPIAETDGDGNTYQLRPLSDGSRHRVLKNFPDRAEFTALLDGRARNLDLVELPYFWRLRYEVAG
ncbi:MAG: class I SAM-dependent methyltransferase [Hyphomicrobiales bacterium]|nr:class I SAM-dependent methyltransferase [Hyphomicrobiales bacterium]MCP5371126.1 class I SAM-dependent methyltransferase [Hyphomicrobiales bacterium]